MLHFVLLIVLFCSLTCGVDKTSALKRELGTKMSDPHFIPALVQSRNKGVQVRSRNSKNDEHCHLVCKNPGDSAGNGSSTVIYISESETVIGFYDSSTDYAFLVDISSSQFFLIIDIKSQISGIFCLKTGEGYYASASVQAKGIYSSSLTVVEYFKSVTSLAKVFQKYKEHGQSFSIKTSGEIDGGSEVKGLIQGFIKATFEQENQLTLERWRSFAYAVYKWAIHALHTSGMYEIFESGHAIIVDIEQYESGSGDFGHNSTQTLESFLQILRQLGGDDAHFNDDIEELLQQAGVAHAPELVGFLRFFELLSSLNVSAAQNGHGDLSEFLNSNSRFSREQFLQILQSVPGLGRFLRMFIRAGGGQNSSWSSIFGVSFWRNIPGLQQFLRFVTDNPFFSGLLFLGESFAEAIRDFAESFLTLANSGPFPNSLGPMVGAFSGGVGGFAGQVDNIFDLLYGFSGGESHGGTDSQSDESRDNVQHNRAAAAKALTRNKEIHARN